ncbi:hypothetical protein BC628DRAFT_1402565 [Trametes gibbosa]|nr:hypothetical protein BC628DRAFT_1402565 [Trametes gibbosa]
MVLVSEYLSCSLLLSVFPFCVCHPMSCRVVSCRAVFSNRWDVDAALPVLWA